MRRYGENRPRARVEHGDAPSAWSHRPEQGRHDAARAGGARGGGARGPDRARGAGGVTALGDLLGDLSEEDCARLAARLAPYLRPSDSPDEWLDAKQAAAYLCVPLSSLHKTTASRAIPFEQAAPGCKLFFRRSDLDAWRRAGERCIVGA